MLGPWRGGAVKLDAAANALMIGEGIETCLAAMQATGRPAWAALSTSGLRALELPDTITDVTVLDISEEALAAVRARTVASPTPPSFVVADVTTWTPERTWDAWHDRAVFHFLTDPDDRATYVANAHRAIAPGGVAIVATFGVAALWGHVQYQGLVGSQTITMMIRELILFVIAFVWLLVVILRKRRERRERKAAAAVPT